jgi:hypothetical protein
MRAVTCANAKLEVVDQPTPAPAKGQLLIDVLRCGMCGSDLHARHHCTVGLAGVEAAFDALGDPETRAKILIDPKTEAASPQPVEAAAAEVKPATPHSAANRPP